MGCQLIRWGRLALIWIVAAGCASAPSDKLGTTAPDFSLEQLDGDTFKLSEHIGKKVIILNFFATWCAPCEVEMPGLSRYIEDHHELPVVLIGIDDGEAPELVEAFVRDADVTFPVGIDDGDVRYRYGVRAFPTTVVIGVDGKIQSHEAGVILRPEAALGALVARNLEALEAGSVVTRTSFADARTASRESRSSTSIRECSPTSSSCATRFSWSMKPGARPR